MPTIRNDLETCSRNFRRERAAQLQREQLVLLTPDHKSRNRQPSELLRGYRLVEDWPGKHSLGHEAIVDLRLSFPEVCRLHENSWVVHASRSLWRQLT